MYGEVGRLVDEAIRLNVRTAENAVLLTVAMNYAWAATWCGVYQWAGGAMRAHMESRARTNRLIRQGVPVAAAARGLRVV